MASKSRRSRRKSTKVLACGHSLAPILRWKHPGALVRTSFLALSRREREKKRKNKKERRDKGWKARNGQSHLGNKNLIHVKIFNRGLSSLCLVGHASDISYSFRAALSGIAWRKREILFLRATLCLKPLLTPRSVQRERRTCDFLPLQRRFISDRCRTRRTKARNVRTKEKRRDRSEKVLGNSSWHASLWCAVVWCAVPIEEQAKKRCEIEISISAPAADFDVTTEESR